MDVEYTGRQTTITKKLKLQVEAGLARIAKIVGKSGNVHVILSTDKYRQIAEITVQTRNQKLVATCEATDMVFALQSALDKLEKQMIRHKKKHATIKRHPKGDVKAIRGKAETDGAGSVAVKTAAVKVATKNSVGRKAVPMLVHSFPSHSPLSEPHVARSNDGVARRPMSLEEAVKEAAFRDRDVFVFRDPKGQAMVLHRKRDGKMELIEVP
ncbi:MAG: Ribosomal subunit interface protein [Edaphobacter sp.]|nr:Ribosomal subunit interface protein [Edaphobacter sp.]